MMRVHPNPSSERQDDAEFNAAVELITAVHNRAYRRKESTLIEVLKIIYVVWVHLNKIWRE